MKPIGYYNEAHGFLHDEFDKDCYCQGGCSMEAVYTESQVKKLTGENKTEKLQEQLNTAKKAPKEISEDVPKPPKYNLNAEFWRTQWSEASGAHLMEYLRAEKLKKDNEILKKALTEISELSDPLDNDTLMSVVANVAGEALAAIGGDE